MKIQLILLKVISLFIYFQASKGKDIACLNAATQTLLNKPVVEKSIPRRIVSMGRKLL